MKWLDKYQDGGKLDKIYSKYPALKNLGEVTLKPDTTFTTEKTGIGDIEYFSPTQDTIRYDNYKVGHPKLGTHGILYNPNTNDEQDIALDMLHGMKQSDTTYSKLRDKLSSAYKKSKFYSDFEREYKENPNPDGKDQAWDNWLDGQIRGLMFEGTDEDFNKHNYWKDAKNVYLKDSTINDAFSKLNKYITTNKYQNGGEMKYYQEGLDFKPKSMQVGGDLDPIQQWNLDYVNSPKYKERLKSSGYENVDEEVKSRAQNILNTNINYENPGFWESLKQFKWPVDPGSHVRGENVNLDYPYDLEGFSRIYKEDMMTLPRKDEILAHELGHREIRKEALYGRLNEYDVRNLEDRGMNLPRVNAHDKKAKENKSDLNAFRYNLMKEGIYDAGKEEFTQEHLDKAKRTFTKDRLMNNYTDKNLIWLMNNIALNQNKNTKSNIAKDGMVIEDDRGQWAHPGKITKINSNKITMKGVKYPVIGISNTGDERLMMPGADYRFDGDTVTEYPLAQNGKNLNNIQNPITPTEEQKEQMNAWLDKLEYDLPIKQREDFSSLSPTLSEYFGGWRLNEGNLRDLYRYYGGVPLKDDVITYSRYQPTNSKDKDTKYIAIKNNNFKQDAINHYKRLFIDKTPRKKADVYIGKGEDNKINENTYSVSGYKRPEKGKPIEDEGAIGRYFISQGEDENGKYLSYYDVFDAGQSGSNLNEKLNIVKPFEIYDRIYEKDFDSIQNLEKMNGGGEIVGPMPVSEPLKVVRKDPYTQSQEEMIIPDVRSNYVVPNYTSTSPEQIDWETVRKQNPQASDFLNRYNSEWSRKKLAEQTGLSQEELDNVILKGATTKITSDDIGNTANAYFDNSRNVIKTKKGVDKGTIVHEIGHASGLDVLQSAAIQKELGNTYHQTDVSSTPEMKRELNKPYETYGHFSGFRERLGIKPGQQIKDEKQLDALIKAKKLENEPFYKTFDKKKIINALNKIAYNSSNSQNNYAEYGTELQKLDQLTNFTNYNTPQPRGWLKKYLQ